MSKSKSKQNVLSFFQFPFLGHQIGEKDGNFTTVLKYANYFRYLITAGIFIGVGVFLGSVLLWSLGISLAALLLINHSIRNKAVSRILPFVLVGLAVTGIYFLFASGSFLAWPATIFFGCQFIIESIILGPTQLVNVSLMGDSVKMGYWKRVFNYSFLLLAAAGLFTCFSLSGGDLALVFWPSLAMFATTSFRLLRDHEMVLLDKMGQPRISKGFLVGDWLLQTLSSASLWIAALGVGLLLSGQPWGVLIGPAILAVSIGYFIHDRVIRSLVSLFRNPVDAKAQDVGDMITYGENLGLGTLVAGIGALSLPELLVLPAALAPTFIAVGATAVIMSYAMSMFLPRESGEKLEDETPLLQANENSQSDQSGNQDLAAAT